MQLPVTSWSNLTESQRVSLLRRPALTADDDLQSSVLQILNRVREQGDEAIRRYGVEFDGIDLESTAVTEEEFELAEQSMSEDQKSAIDFAIRNVHRFHELQRPVDQSIETVPGVLCERISQPLESVGLYVPAGSAPLPSTAVMLCVPARIAGCPMRTICTPPRADGHADPAVLATARRAGTTSIFKVGGAQAIAALAYGTDQIPKADKIFGPGNAWVTAAKSAVAQDPCGSAIDMPAGPSEVLVIADESANSSFVAADLLSQAEHGADSQAVLVTDSRELAFDVIKNLSHQIEKLARAEIAKAAMQQSRIVLVGDLDQAIEVSNRYAPEHLIIQTIDPRGLLAGVRNAGSVFLGPWSPESAGDYCSGTNHVLPTYGYARACSGLSVEQFMRHMTVQELSKAGLKALAPAIDTLASMEGLDAHANAVRVRLADETG